jgi:hypothetical protein
MKNKVSNGANKIVTWILNIIIIVLSLFLFLMIFLVIAEFRSAFNWERSTDSFGYYMSSEEYFQITPAYHTNIANGYEPDEEVAEYYGVAQYFEAALIYNAYVETDNEEMAQVYKEKMQAAEGEMGGWNIAIPSIHKQLGIEE